MIREILEYKEGSPAQKSELFIQLVPLRSESQITSVAVYMGNADSLMLMDYEPKDVKEGLEFAKKLGKVFNIKKVNIKDRPHDTWGTDVAGVEKGNWIDL